MTAARGDEIRQDAITVLEQICNKGYTLEDMMIFARYVEAFRRNIEANAQEKNTMKDFFLTKAQRKYCS